MQRYKNLAESSGISAFQLSEGRIVVQFKNGFKYEYTEDSAGADAIATMHHLAVTGRGLGTFISTHVHNAYARKIR